MQSQLKYYLASNLSLKYLLGNQACNTSDFSQFSGLKSS